MMTKEHEKGKMERDGSTFPYILQNCSVLGNSMNSAEEGYRIIAHNNNVDN